MYVGKHTRFCQLAKGSQIDMTYANFDQRRAVVTPPMQIPHCARRFASLKVWFPKPLIGRFYYGDSRLEHASIGEDNLS